MTPLLLDGHWYTSKAALGLLSGQLVIGDPHETPDGRAVLVFDRGGLGSIVNGQKPDPVPARLVPQATAESTLDGQPLRDLMTLRGGRLARIQLDPAMLPDLERLAEFDHLPESRKAGALADGLHRPGDRLA